jgi:hypothetical protein
MLFPVAQGAYETASLTQCSHRLYCIGQAYNARASEGRIVGEQIKTIRVTRWKTDLRPYLEMKSDLLTCPAANDVAGIPEGWDEDIHGGDSLVGGGGSSARPDIYNETEKSDAGVSLENLKVEVWLRPGSDFRGVKENTLIYVMDCEEGQWARKFHGGSTNPIGSQVPSGTYELWFEDSWNETWNDLGIRFKEHDDGSLDITYIDERTGGNCYNLVDTSTGETLLKGMGDGNAALGWPRLSLGTSIKMEPEDEQPAVMTDEELAEFAEENTTGSGISGRATTGRYGMNSRANNREVLPGHVILVMDYLKTVAYGPTTNMPDNWQKRGWQTKQGEAVFARHFGRVNILFSDGTVELVDPLDINPARFSTVEKIWDPDIRK